MTSLVVMGQDTDAEQQELEKSMQKQRDQYQAILKTVGGDGLENDPEFQKMIKGGIKDPKALMEKLQQIRAKNGKSTDVGTIGQSGQKFSAKDLFKGNASKIISMMLQQFSNMSDDQVKASMLRGAQGKPQEKFLKNNPKFLNFAAKLFKDPIALPQFAKIIDQRRKLTFFVGANICVFLFGFFVRKVQKNRNPEKQFTTTMNQFIFRQILMNSIRLGVFLAFFHNEVGPLWKVFRSTMFA
ncbi:MAG: hypothetical protein KC478_10460 [Bacteriovoracaceae bacterium]|nr:hypothetical protein [Bacteriovoracaceae bacterium]